MTPWRNHYTTSRRTIYILHEYYIVLYCISMQWRYPQIINWTINLARMLIVQRTKYCKIKSYLVVYTADAFKQNCVSICIHIVDIFCSKTEPPFSHFMCDVLFTNGINIYSLLVSCTFCIYLFQLAVVMWNSLPDTLSCSLVRCTLRNWLYTIHYLRNKQTLLDLSTIVLQ